MREASSRIPFVIAAVLVAGAATTGAIVMHVRGGATDPPPAPAEPIRASAPTGVEHQPPAPSPTPLGPSPTATYTIVQPNPLARVSGELPVHDGPVEICVDANGRVVAVSVPADVADGVASQLVQKLSAIRYAPFVRNGVATPACTTLFAKAKVVIQVPTPIAPVPALPPTQSCADTDEVSCVLNNYEGFCCQKFKKPTPKVPTPITSSLPDSVSRNDIVAVMASLKSDLVACGDLALGGGKIKLRVKVAPDGNVTETTADPANTVGGCMRMVMAKAKFPKTTSGGSFAYPIVY